MGLSLRFKHIVVPVNQTESSLRGEGCSFTNLIVIQSSGGGGSIVLIRELIRLLVYISSGQLEEKTECEALVSHICILSTLANVRNLLLEM